MTEVTPAKAPAASASAPANTTHASLPATVEPAAPEGPIAKWTKYVGARSIEFAELARSRSEHAAEQVRDRSRAMLLRRSRRKLLAELGDFVFEQRVEICDLLSAPARTRLAKIEALDEELRALEAEVPKP